MPLPGALLNQIKCCLSNDGHILIEPVVLKCTGSACKECISDSEEEVIYCYACNGKHQKNDLLNATVNTVAKILVENFIVVWEGIKLMKKAGMGWFKKSADVNRSQCDQIGRFIGD